MLAKFAYNDLKARRVAILKDIQQDYSVGLTDSIQKTFTALGGTGARPGELQLGRRRLPRHPDAGPRQKPDAIFAHRLLPGGGHHRPPGARARHDDADSRRRRLGRRRAEERPRGADEHLHLEPLLGRQPRSGRPELRARRTARSSTASPTRSPRSATTRPRCSPTRSTRAGSTDGPKVRDALAAADVPGVTGRLKMNAEPQRRQAGRHPGSARSSTAT